ncbi:MAG: hypothetical protein GX591_07820 [Planctomycetes bacterium]|nr:hypothetical protein [Planctomycetota bacterium]
METRLGPVGEDVEMRWSRDTRHVAYAIVRDGRHYLVLDGTPGAAFDEIQRYSIRISPDGSRAACVGRRGKEWYFAVDDRVHGPFDAISSEELVFGESGNHFAFVGSRGGCEHAVIDGSVGPGYASVTNIVLSPDGKRYAYLARTPREDWSAEKSVFGDERTGAFRTSVVVDGRVLPEVDALFMGGGLTPWPEFSQDGRRWALIASCGEKQYVLVDGRADPAFDRIRSYSLTFSPDGRHYAYVAQHGESAMVVTDGVASSPHTDIFELTWSPATGELAYVARDDDGWRVVVAGRAGPRFDHCWGLTFSPCGRRLAYAAAAGERECAVVDGIQGPWFEYVGDLAQHPHLVFTFSHDGSHLAYCATQGEQSCMVLDGTPGPWYFSVDRTVTFSPDDKHVAYVAAKELFAERIVRDGREGPAFRGIQESTLRFSPDGKSVACMAAVDNRPVVVIDDWTGPRGDMRWAGEPVFISNDVVEYLAVSQDSLYRVRCERKGIDGK